MTTPTYSGPFDLLNRSAGLPYAERLPGGVWRITDASWPRSRMWEAVWTPGRYGWEINDAFRFRGTDWASVINRPDAFKINTNGA